MRTAIESRSKKFIKINLMEEGLTDKEDRYLIVNTDNGKDFKIKTNYSGEKKKIHLSKEVFELAVEMVELLSNGF